MTRARREERMAMTRLAAVCEQLHETASDVSQPDEARLEAAGALAQTFLKHFELLTLALRTAGK